MISFMISVVPPVDAHLRERRHAAEDRADPLFRRNLSLALPRVPAGQRPVIVMGGRG
jgi:hypothetical protein